MAKISIDITKPIVCDIVSHKKEMAYQAVSGNCKQYKAAAQAYSKLAVDNFETAKDIPGIELKGKVPLAAKLNMLKIMVFNFFRKKSPEEKQLRNMVKEYRARQSIDINKP